MPHSRTIFALSSGRGVAGVGVIRVSGPQARDVLTALLADKSKMPAERRASVRRLYSPVTGRLLDEAVVLRFDGPKSFTGEDVVEVHCHGGAATVSGLLEAIGSVEGVVPAQAGEFTRRAFEAGRLSLTEVEGLADLLLAQTDKQRDQALSIISGALERRFTEWRDQVATIRAAAEAAIDFGDHVEGEVDSDEALAPLEERIQHLQRGLRRALNEADRTLAIRDGALVVLAGPPNAGKSSLLNVMAARPAAIVSSTAGTTRDVLEVRLNLGGFDVRLFDTAGIRNATADDIEAEGVRRAQELCSAAHVVCYVIDSVAPDLSMLPDTVDLVVANKIDLLSEKRLPDDAVSGLVSVPVIAASALEPGGADDLTTAVEALVIKKLAAVDGQDEAPAIARERHRRHVSRCLDALDAALEHRSEAELFAEDLRLASAELGKLVGAIDVEDVLDSLFRDFCIGK